MEKAKTNIISAADKYFRREDTLLSELLKIVNSKRGEKYLNGKSRRALELSVSIPASIVSAPIIGVLGLMKKLEDGGTAFFVQQRLGKNSMTDSIGVVKIRCMHENSDLQGGNIDMARKLEPENDPRNTNLGKFMRKYQLEELPQLMQVVLGQLSLIGIRATPLYGLKYLQENWKPERYEKFIELYKLSGGSLVDIQTVLSSDFTKKGERAGFHSYSFYAENANLGLDLYLLWRTFLKLGRLSAKLKRS
ncbi:hypothetical protein A2774_03670 [Candidatus Roizmanbacteria bacterium RIFCSPHIGHO2_01_FULL_39_12c]|uniref:Bacterial sugar transferase domain-containing protein n=1 Tax=Candidatus Roizmanbacteria bacterium RIFCSPHIGHO2_01_FULL_39_12c TaxID=1802031 RepID=A0A1F7GAT6_9BACT|nr:MAG: hypothetical protein A2774_03670 [Candidatus Roizmanbacteria bacterium RIFCSPHIGHO2_01_FULL_39_12c]OGK46736.1 MAG: hypothetical protein A2963_00715 [Candidatus Roizmanbacteria bacterium RIFCSPLOWO2_01_FULL_40_13]